MGVKCRGCQKVLQPDMCPEGCPEGHGFTFVVCLACEAVAEACLCAGHYMACDEPCPDFWLPDVPMSPDKGHAETAPEEES